MRKIKILRTLGECKTPLSPLYMKEAFKQDCPPYLRDYLTYVRVIRNHTERTEDEYYIDLRTFLRYLKVYNGDVPENADFEQITIKDVPLSYVENFTLNGAYEYMNFLLDKRGNNNDARSRKTSSLRQFYEYLSKKAMLIKSNPIEQLEHPKAAQKLPKFLELEQSQQLLSEIDSRNRKRDFCIITLFLNCGMRLSELVGLNIGDYSESARTLRVFGKGQKERIIYINDACISALNDYIKVRPKSIIDPDALFLSSHANNIKRLSNRRVQRIVEDQLNRAGLGNLGISTHKLRHTAATLMYEYGGVDPMVLKEVLGHKSVATTQIYTHLSDADRRNAAENSPLANFKAPKRKGDAPAPSDGDDKE